MRLGVLFLLLMVSFSVQAQKKKIRKKNKNKEQKIDLLKIPTDFKSVKSKAGNSCYFLDEGTLYYWNKLKDYEVKPINNLPSTVVYYNYILGDNIKALLGQRFYLNGYVFQDERNSSYIHLYPIEQGYCNPLGTDVNMNDSRVLIQLENPSELTEYKINYHTPCILEGVLRQNSNKSTQNTYLYILENAKVHAPLHKK